MWENSALAYFLANLFFRQDDFINIIINAGFNPGDVVITNSAINNWTFILYEAEQNNKKGNIVAAALKRKPDNEILKSYLDSKEKLNFSTGGGKDINWKNNVQKKQKEALTNEQSTLLPINFLEKGAQKAKCVVYIKTPLSIGTGFVIKDDYLLTNNHVIKDIESAKQAVVVFNYERNEQLQFKKLIYARLAPDLCFETNEATDWTIVKLMDSPLKANQYLSIAKKIPAEMEFVNIIQHPGGDEKMIGIYHNLVTYSGDGILQYLTDTQEGSSGSPVFNSQWDVVALHHSSCRLENTAIGDELRNQGATIDKVAQEVNSIRPGLIG